jgi:hypothetical protein
MSSVSERIGLSLLLQSDAVLLMDVALHDAEASRLGHGTLSVLRLL